jgi:hypothetical protein
LQRLVVAVIGDISGRPEVAASIRSSLGLQGHHRRVHMRSSRQRVETASLVAAHRPVQQVQQDARVSVDQRQVRISVRTMELACQYLSEGVVTVE